MKLNELKTEAFSIAKANGWHDIDYPDSHWLMLVITEISEAIEADRKGKHVDKKTASSFVTMMKEQGDELFKIMFENTIKDTFEDECADICIRLLDLAGLRNIDVFSDIDVMVEKKQYDDICKPLYELCQHLTSKDKDLYVKIGATLSFIFCLSGQYDFDLKWFIEQKMKYNKLRGYHHGGKKY